MTNGKDAKTDSAWTSTIVLCMILAIPLLSLLSALIYRTAWDLTLSTQFGDGPTLKSWFGVSLVTKMLFQASREDGDNDDDDKTRPAKERLLKIIRGTVFMYGLQVLFLLVAWATCWTLGW